jgi:ABC-2 type transport system ATP-binding protein
MNALTIENVSKSFGQVCAVDGLSVEIPHGCVYGFLGPNGAGKTTTIRMVMDIIRPDSGRISIDGDGGRAARELIGYMPEERGLYRKMTVRAILDYFGGIKGVPAGQLAERVPRWLEQMDLSGWANRKVEELSKGMQQKLQLAVTAINEPRILLLDEPFSGLDPINQELVKRMILKMRDEGRTIVFSTHVMHDAETLCDMILLINKGRPVLNGKWSQIRSQYRSNSVVADLDGERDFVSSLPMVKGVQQKDGAMEISLSEDGDPQELLKALIGRVRVRRFEVKMPSLHEIFISQIGGGQ